MSILQTGSPFLSFISSISITSALANFTAFEKALKLEGYDRMIQNPYTDPEAVTRDFLVDIFAKGDTDKYMKKMNEAMPGMMPGVAPQQGASPMVQQAQQSNRGALQANLSDLVK